MFKFLRSCFPRRRRWKEPKPRQNGTRSVEWLLAHRQRDMRAQMLHQSRQRKPREDTPTTPLYRIYVDIVDDFTVELRHGIEYFFNRVNWRVADTPDPKDPDPQRYAILSVIPHLLVPAFNRLIERRLARDAPAIIMDFEELAARPRILEEVPDWCARVPALKETLTIPNEDGEVLTDKDDPRASPEFLVKNIPAFKHHTA